MKLLVLSSLVIVIVSSITLLVYHHVNKFKRMDRFYYENNKWLYIVTQLCYWIVFVSFILNARFIAYIIIEFIVFRYSGYRLQLVPRD
jgi:hypothetical protein